MVSQIIFPLGNKGPADRGQTRGPVTQRACCPNQGGVAGSKFDLEQGGFEIGMPDGISSRSERCSRLKSIQPIGLRLRGLLAALLMPVKPARIHRHESRNCGTQKLHGARNNSHPVLGNRPNRTLSHPSWAGSHQASWGAMAAKSRFRRLMRLEISLSNNSGLHCELVHLFRIFQLG